MPGSKPNHKSTGKPARQLLFSEALHHKRPTSMTTGTHASSSPNPAHRDVRQGTVRNHGTDITGDHRCQPLNRGNGRFYILTDPRDQIHVIRHCRVPI
ncbi:hypothetical protein NDU88_002800 [Pleurodeles waltl]|uniref:Uncharacterized protein n=1 Tax=Pleurodeles waltl TaxID=8319 RepID=A0AAV7VFM2_PLEWA|nr:hypothetical protein NDU88_002800 [Pleurodeles waltl]